MQAQAIQPLYTFPTREEERAAKKALEANTRFLRSRRLWADRHQRQKLWRVALDLVSQLEKANQIEKFLSFLDEKRAGVVPCALHPITMAKNQLFPGEPEYEVRDVVNSDQLEEALGLQGLVVGSRWQRSQMWDLVELRLRGHTPSDLEVLYDCEQQCAVQCILLEAWECKWGLEDGEYKTEDVSVEAAREFAVIFCGHAQGVEIYSWGTIAVIKRYAALYSQARHSGEKLCSVLPRTWTKMMYLSFPRERAEGEVLAVGTRPLSEWLTYGIESISDFPYDKRRNRQVFTRKLPAHLDVGSDAGSGEFTEHQLFGLAQGVLPRWPRSQLPLLQLIEERLCNQRRRRFDERAFQKAEPTQRPSYVEQVEQEILGRVFTAGSPARRELFWVYMCALSMGMKEYCRSYSIHPDYSPSRTTTLRLQQVASYMITEGANPFHLCKLVEYGRGGLTEPVPSEGVPEGERVNYAELRYFADYGVAAFGI